SWPFLCFPSARRWRASSRWIYPHQPRRAGLGDDVGGEAVVSESRSAADVGHDPLIGVRRELELQAHVTQVAAESGDLLRRALEENLVADGVRLRAESMRADDDVRPRAVRGAVRQDAAGVDRSRADRSKERAQE